MAVQTTLLENRQVALLEMDKLNSALEKISLEEGENKELIRHLNDIFVQKNLNLRTVACIFNGNKQVKELEEIEKIAFTNGCYDILRDEELDVKKYFSDLTLSNYETFINVNEFIDIIKLKNFIMIDEYNYRGMVTYKDVYDYLTQMLILYNKATQRASKISYLGTTGLPIREPNVDNSAVRDIADVVLSDDFEESEIILNIRILKNKNPQINIQKKYENIVDVTIKPNYNTGGENYTVVEILDGYHRILGIVLALNDYYNKTGEWKSGSIGVKLVIADYNRAIKIVKQTFKRTDTDQTWLKSIEDTDYSKFADKIIKNSEYLKGNVGNMYEECIYFNKVTYKSLLNDTVEKLQIPINDFNSSYFTPVKLGNNLDEFFKYVNFKYCNEKLLKNPHIVAGYLKYFYDRIDIEDFKMADYENLVQKVLSFTSKEIKSMKLDIKNCVLNRILELF